MMKLSGESMSKTKIVQKLSLQHQTVSKGVSAKAKFFKEIKSASKHMNEKMKQPYFWYGESFSGLDGRSNQPQTFF